MRSRSQVGGESRSASSSLVEKPDISSCGLRADQFTLRLTRAEIGNYLGMTLETVSRALSKLARDKVIAFTEKGRRDVSIPDVKALSAFVQRCLAPVPTLK